ncbi:hypothetical protein ABBQ32_004901 [Trebouxia sp. C0010 RCD-2024]
MRLVAALLCMLAVGSVQGTATGNKRRLAQESTPLALNITLVGITLIKPEQADRIPEALLNTLPEPKPRQVVVSSNTASKDDKLTLIILVYPPASADASLFNSSLWKLDTAAFSNRLNDFEVTTSSVILNSIAPQPQRQYQRDPLAGASLAGQAISFAFHLGA